MVERNFGTTGHIKVVATVATPAHPAGSWKRPRKTDIYDSIQKLNRAAELLPFIRFVIPT